MRIGYARVSTAEQNLDMQIDELNGYGCMKIYQEKISGKDMNRSELNLLLNSLRKGDVVVVWKLDRLGRSVKDLIEIVNTIKDKGADFCSLHDGITTTSAIGRFTFNLFASLAEFEREIIRERTLAGLASARERGKIGGRPAGLSKLQQSKAKTVRILYDTNDKSITEIAKELNIGRSTCYRYLNASDVINIHVQMVVQQQSPRLTQTRKDMKTVKIYPVNDSEKLDHKDEPEVAYIRKPTKVKMARLLKSSVTNNEKK